MAGTNTVIDLKSAFIRRQTRVLSQPLQAPQQWKDDCDIPDAAIRSAMREGMCIVITRKGPVIFVSFGFSASLLASCRFELQDLLVGLDHDNLSSISFLFPLHKHRRGSPANTPSVNRRLTRHNKTAYSTIAIRHTAEQIDALYWQTTAPQPSSFTTASSLASDQTSTNPFHPAADLASPTIIAALPPSWDDVDPDHASTLLRPSHTTTTTTTSSSSSSSQRQLQHTYGARAARLHALSSRRAAARRKLARLEALRRALRPLADPAASVQPNLATRDGELAAEVARTRTLGVRVAARVGERVEAAARRNGHGSAEAAAAAAAAGRDDVEDDDEVVGEERDGHVVVVVVGGTETVEERHRNKLEKVLDW